MSSRGVLYLVWGKLDQLLQRSIASLKEVHPDLPYHVERLSDESSYLDKVRMCELSPFDTTAYLDADTVVIGNLDFAFEKAEQHGVACCINEAPWARRYTESGLKGDAVEYNAGVVFFDKTHPKCQTFFSAWSGCANAIDSSSLFNTGEGLKRQPCNDQAGMAKAFEDTGIAPYVLPLNWNLRPMWHRAIVGNVKIWHDYQDPPESLLSHSRKTEHETTLDCVQFTNGADVPEEGEEPEPTLNIACAMSVPRLGFQDNFFSISEALTPLGIRPVHYDGVFWGQCLERVMVSQLEADWILSIDYDTVFRKSDVQKLISLAARSPDADAIAAVQLRRKSNELLMAIKQADGSLLPGVERETFSADLVEAHVAHFGLTLFRTSALKKMEHPWFLNVPDETGNWGEKKQDEDIYFWRKFRASGNRLFVAPRVPVGHMETLITWPDGNMEAIHQHPCDFWAQGKPVNTWR
jgi:hypothetical protein